MKPSELYDLLAKELVVNDHTDAFVDAILHLMDVIHYDSGGLIPKEDNLTLLSRANYVYEKIL